MAKRSKYVDISEAQPEVGQLVRVIIAGLATPKLAEYHTDRNGPFWRFEGGKEAAVVGDDRWKPHER